MRGKLHVEIFDSSYPGETEEGAARLVAKVRSAVNKRFQGDAAKPDFLMVDRGRGFYNIATGKITAKYKSALEEHGLTNMMGDNAAKQPGHMQEIMLHETSVAWIRNRLAVTTPRDCWLESVEDYATRLKTAADYINTNFDVGALCKDLPQRLEDLVEAQGGRSKK